MRKIWSCGAGVSVLALSIVAGCASAPPEPNDPDWTNRACEAPAFVDILGTYAGSISYRDGSLGMCQWDTQIAITGVSMASDCNLTGTIAAIPEVEENDEFRCASFDVPTQFVAGLSDENLNRVGPSSVIVHMIDLLPTVSDSGIAMVNPIHQFEALTAFGGKLTTDAGYILLKSQ